MVFQAGKKGCGIASLKMLLVRLSGERGYAYMEADAHPPYSLKELMEIAQKEGFSLFFKEASNKDELDKAQGPLLLLLGDKESSHMVYVSKIRKGCALVFDPMEGESWIPLNVLKEKWSLIYGEGSIQEKRKCPYKRKNILGWGERWLSYMFLSIAVFGLFGAFYFLGDEDMIPVSILLFALYGIFGVLSRSLLMSSMKRFDGRYLAKLENGEGGIQERYSRYSSFKKDYFASFYQYIEYCLVFGGLCLLVGLNNPFFLIGVSGLLLYKLLGDSSFRKRIEQEKREVAEEEKRIFKENDVSSLEKLNGVGYSIGKRLSFYSFISLVITMGLASLTLLNGNISLNNYLFHLFSLLGAGTCLDKFIAFAHSKKERALEEAYFREYILK